MVHDKTVTWLANWVENVNGNYKYVFLAAGSSLKGQSDMSKFEKARELKVSSTLPRIDPDPNEHVETRLPDPHRLPVRPEEQSDGRPPTRDGHVLH